jgi:hypothetical protein
MAKWPRRPRTELSRIRRHPHNLRESGKLPLRRFRYDMVALLWGD